MNVSDEPGPDHPRGSRYAFLLTVIIVLAALAMVGGAMLLTP